MILDIHLEYCDDGGEKLKKIARLDKPFCISPIPALLKPQNKVCGSIYSKNYFYSQSIVKILKRLSKKSNVILGQQGLQHYCVDCFKEKEKKDAWHENYCFYSKQKTVNEQIKFMKQGKKIIEEVLGVSPKLYVPPNHMFDNNTIIAAKKLGFQYLADKAMIKLYPYTSRGLIILPETKLSQKGEFVYTHYDKITNNLNQYLNFIKSPNYLGQIIPRKVSLLKISKNRKLKLNEKKKRDLKKSKSTP